MNTTDAPPIIPRSIRCSLDRWDVLRCRLWVTAHNRKLLTILVLMCMAVAVLTYRKAPEGFSFPPAFFFIVYFLMTTALVIALNVCFLVAFHALWLFINPNRGVVGEHEFEIRDDGFLERTPFNESVHRWAGFHKIASSNNCLFVFVTDNIVHYIPLRVFPSRQDADIFLAELRKRANL